MKRYSAIKMLLLIAVAIVASCTTKELDIISNNPSVVEEVVSGKMQFSATVTVNSPVTKAVDANGVTTWVVDEEIAVYYEKNESGTYGKATANVVTVNDAGRATISAELDDDAKNGGTVKFIYPASIVNATGDAIDASKLATQHGTIEDISAHFDVATGSSTLVINGSTCATADAAVTMTNQLLIGKFTPKCGGSAIDGITELTINDGTITYSVKPSSGTFGTDGIYVAMLPIDNQEVAINATAGSDSYCYNKSGISLAAGKLYSNLDVNMLLRYNLALGSFYQDKDAYIYQDPSTATTNTITISNGRRIVLAGVNIEAENTNAINCLGDAEIVLSGTNNVKSVSDKSTSGTLNKAVIKAGTYKSTTAEPPTTTTTLTISGDGTLNANPVYASGATSPNHNGAVIGADFEGSCGNIVINGGTITVSTNYGAAIGSGRVGSGTSKCGSITINGGTINATGSTGAGIGSGGRQGSKTGTTSCDGITITGGNVTARSVGGAAIGAGKCEGGGSNSDSYCGNILITGGTIDAQTTNTGDYAGAAIGGGYHSKAGDITISGGNIKAVGSRNSAGIGAGGRQGQCGNILINGGSVDAQGGYGNNYEGAGIGTGKGSANNAKSTCGTITITNGVTIVKAKNVTAVATNSTAKKSIGKGSISYTQCGTVTINGKTGEIDGNVQYVYQPGAGS